MLKAIIEAQAKVLAFICIAILAVPYAIFYVIGAAYAFCRGSFNDGVDFINKE